jgi:hypothetical protein
VPELSGSFDDKLKQTPGFGIAALDNHPESLDIAISSCTSADGVKEFLRRGLNELLHGQQVPSFHHLVNVVRVDNFDTVILHAKLYLHIVLGEILLVKSHHSLSVEEGSD